MSKYTKKTPTAKLQAALPDPISISNEPLNALGFAKNVEEQFKSLLADDDAISRLQEMSGWLDINIREFIEIGVETAQACQDVTQVFQKVTQVFQKATQVCQDSLAYANAAESAKNAEERCKSLLANDDIVSRMGQVLDRTGVNIRECIEMLEETAQRAQETAQRAQETVQQAQAIAQGAQENVQQAQAIAQKSHDSLACGFFWLGVYSQWLESSPSHLAGAKCFTAGKANKTSTGEKARRKAEAEAAVAEAYEHLPAYNNGKTAAKKWAAKKLSISPAELYRRLS